MSKKDGKNTYTCKQFFNDQYTCGKDQITLIWLFFSHLKIKIIISLLQLTTYHVYCYHKTTTGFRVFINKQSTKVKAAFLVKKESSRVNQLSKNITWSTKRQRNGISLIQILSVLLKWILKWLKNAMNYSFIF